MAASPAQRRENGAKGGRRESSPTRLTRVKANELSQSGNSPIDVMINNMLFWFDHSKSLTEQVSEAVIQLTPEGVATDPEAVNKLTKLMKEMLYARENAQKCAVDAAPYCHPKLASITMIPAPPQPALRAVQAGLTAKDAAAAYAERLKG